MEYNKLVSTALDRYITRLTQVGYYPDKEVYNLIALVILEELSEFLTDEDIVNCKLDKIIGCLTNSCLTSGLNKACPDISNFVNILHLVE